MFSESVKKCIKNYFRIKGRTSRATYWYFMLLTGITYLLQSICFIDYITYQGSMALWLNTLFMLVLLFLFIPTITATCRRLHDIGKAAPFWFVILIPIIGWILMLVWCVRKSDGDNAFGKKNEAD